MRIAIVNDMLMAVEALRRVLASAPEHDVAWVAINGLEAVEKCAKDTPDVILMDLIMPVMDGVEATRRIMEDTPCAILVVTATVRGNAPKVFEAMGWGALDAVNTPVLGADGQTNGGQELLAKIATIGRLVGRPAATRDVIEAPTERLIVDAQVPALVVIGASTGGPKALADVLSHIGSPWNAAIVAVQHVNAQFASGLVEWLGTQISLPVKLVNEGGRVEPGAVLMCKTDDHLVMTPERTLVYTAEPRSNPYRPSVDVFFSSVATYWPEPSVAVILTGMGRDGAQGLHDLHQAGWHTICQDEATSVIYGMPKAAVEMGAADEVLPVDKIGPALLKQVKRTQTAEGKRNVR